MERNQQDEDQTRQAGQQSRQQSGKQDQQDQQDQRRDSGLPGGGVGRREEPGHTGVYPMSSPEGANPDAPLQNENAWGQGERGAAGYQDSGDSEPLNMARDSEEGEQDEE